jgi:hypothetical protein
LEGINAAKARGVYTGRKPTIKREEVRRLRQGGLRRHRAREEAWCRAGKRVPRPPELTA